MNTHLLLALSILFFGFIHSITASNSFKKKISWFKRYQYTILSLITVLPITYLWTKGYMTSKTIYSFEYPWSIIFYISMLVGSVIFVLGALEMDLFAFLGIKEAETDGLSKKGMHGIVRHPLYLGIIIVFWSFPALKTIDLVGNSGLTLYLIIGSYIEERKLIEEYGGEYREYKNETPMFIPKLSRF